MEKLKIEYIPVSELKPYDRNTRKHQEFDVGQIAASIEAFGFDDPIGIWSDKNIIVEGHGRLLAAKKLGMKEVPCIRLDHLTDEQRRAYAIAHNKTAELSEFDFETLQLELEEVDLSMFDFDFDFEAEESDAESEIIEDDVPDLESEKDIISRLGDVWKLGKNILMCGDSTDKECVEKLMDGNKADLLITDPPYNVDYTGKTKDALKIQNDKMDDDSFRQFLRDAFEAADSVMKPGAVFYIWHADSEGYNFRGACADIGWKVRECLIWVKNSLVMGRQDYQWKHEPCLYGWKDGAHFWASDRKQTTGSKRQSLILTDQPKMIFTQQ